MGYSLVDISLNSATHFITSRNPNATPPTHPSTLPFSSPLECPRPTMDDQISREDVAGPGSCREAWCAESEAGPSCRPLAENHMNCLPFTGKERRDASPEAVDGEEVADGIEDITDTQWDQVLRQRTLTSQASGSAQSEVQTLKMDARKIEEGADWRDNEEVSRRHVLAELKASRPRCTRSVPSSPYDQRAPSTNPEPVQQSPPSSVANSIRPSELLTPHLASEEPIEWTISPPSLWARGRRLASENKEPVDAVAGSRLDDQSNYPLLVSARRKGKARATVPSSENEVGSTLTARDKRKERAALSLSTVPSANRKGTISDDTARPTSIDGDGRREDEYDLPLDGFESVVMNLDFDLDLNSRAAAMLPLPATSSRLNQNASVTGNTPARSSILEALDLQSPSGSNVSRPAFPFPILCPPARPSTSRPSTTVTPKIMTTPRPKLSTPAPAPFSPSSAAMGLDHPLMFIKDLAEREKEFYLNHWRRGADMSAKDLRGRWESVNENEDEDEEGHGDEYGDGEGNMGKRKRGPGGTRGKAPVKRRVWARKGGWKRGGGKAKAGARKW